jgi:hypothetical protein
MSKTKWDLWLEKNDQPSEAEIQKEDKAPRTVKPWDMLKTSTEMASDELQEERYSICKGCPKFIKSTSQCKECGCFMAMKTSLLQATCPLNKW